MTTNALVHVGRNRAFALKYLTGIKITNQPAVNIGEITTAFATDTWNNLGGNSFVPFAVNEDASIACFVSSSSNTDSI